MQPHKQPSRESDDDYENEPCEASDKTLDELLALLSTERAKREANRVRIEENAAEIEKLQRRHAELTQQLQAERGHSG